MNPLRNPNEPLMMLSVMICLQCLHLGLRCQFKIQDQSIPSLTASYLMSLASSFYFTLLDSSMYITKSYVFQDFDNST